MLACCCYIYRVVRLFRDLNDSIAQGSLLVTINLKKLQLVQSRLTGLTGLLVRLFLLILDLGMNIPVHYLFISMFGIRLFMLDKGLCCNNK